ncbi:MAG: PIN domain-containing protein [Mogibacterium sp.]|nr:PIN domain-containing protein [Mogibacterium sp.]
MRAIIDTCVIIDYLQCREPFFDDALSVAIASANREIEAYITANTITDIYYIIHRHTHSGIESRRVISKLMTLFGLVDTYAEDCINAVHSEMNDFEDAVMSESAKRINADYIVTRNVRDYSKSKVRVITPSELLIMLDN